MDGERLPNKIINSLVVLLCGTSVDRISQLPDDVIVHILSSLPLKKAAATSILVDNCVALEEIVVGQCDRIDLVRNIVDYCVPLDEIFEGPSILFSNDCVFTIVDRQLLEKTLQQLQIPARIQLRIVELPAQ